MKISGCFSGYMHTPAELPVVDGRADSLVLAAGQWDGMRLPTSNRTGRVMAL